MFRSITPISLSSTVAALFWHKSSAIDPIFNIQGFKGGSLNQNSSVSKSLLPQPTLKWERRGSNQYTQADIDRVRNEWGDFVVKTYVHES
ncbi:hypothetical protein RchiOBHm_Chr5g0044431 [Rosa chinensis]|uniref:Uncharacterized protein n=1 Tax=Rosa chinensis TaxID=74649 RepID=A0A2P6QDM5_ROSCH|nr:hypothetical protein RchiOBHm_Chr5g0044431 [Rosa chinensis]